MTTGYPEHPQTAHQGELPVATAEQAEELCAAIERMMDPLKTVIEAETRHLKAMNIAEAELLQEDKKALAGAYMREISRYKAQAPAVRALAPARIERLAQRHMAFRASILENERILDSLRSASAALIRKTAERMGEQSGGPRTYSRSASGPGAAKPAAVAINRRA
jgi:flagellar biosynthesis/type III secretory pathway chaperone